MSASETARDDERFMRRAVALAERGRGLTSPNPLVGAVVVAAGAVVGEGFHARAGGPHAEIEALAAAGARARGATLYVTLEPCCHQGRTPPCAPVVLEAGIRRVVAGSLDPNPIVGGRGIAEMRARGIDVTVGVLEAEVGRQNRVFFTAMRRRRPHVTLKVGMTLDGKIADVHGASRWITGEPARALAHRMRSEADAIVVGVRTVERDDPQLTVRLGEPWPREPYRVVLDAGARTPPDARVIHAATRARALVVVSPEAPGPRRRALADAGATLVECPASAGRLSLDAVLAALFAREVRAVLVEGGAEVHGAFVDAGLADRVAVFIAPRILGGQAAPAFVGGAGRGLKDALALDDVTVTRLGDDILVEGDVRERG